jgi:hypothetical protein
MNGYHRHRPSQSCVTHLWLARVPLLAGLCLHRTLATTAHRGTCGVGGSTHTHACARRTGRNSAGW